MNKPFSRTLVNPLFLFVCTLMTMGALMVVLYYMSGLAYNEQPIALHHVTSQQLQEVKGNPARVDVGLYIDSFDTFDMISDKFIFNGILTFVFDARQVTLKELEKITIAHGKFLYRSDPIVFSEHDRTTAHYHIRAQCAGNLNYAWYPLEDHRLSIVFVDANVTVHDLVFTINKTDFIAPEMDTQGWHKFATIADAGYLETLVKQHAIQSPAVVFAIEYGQYSNLRNMMTILLPMLLLFVVALFSIIIDPADGFTFALTIPVQVIAGFIAFRFVVESMSPKVGYFMYSDYFFLFFLFLTFIILIFNTLGIGFGSLARKIMIVLFYAIIVLFLILLLHRMDVIFTRQNDISRHAKQIN